MRAIIFTFRRSVTAARQLRFRCSESRSARPRPSWQPVWSLSADPSLRALGSSSSEDRWGLPLSRSEQHVHFKEGM